MSRFQLHTPSLALGALASGLLGVTLATAPMTAPSSQDDAKKWEYKIELDIEDKDLEKLAKDGWEFAGYLGVSKRGSNTDETLWRRLDD